MRAHLALCSHGYLGLITSDAPVATPYSGSYQDVAWTGIHMAEGRDKKIGDRWQSKAPKILCHLSDPLAESLIRRFNMHEAWGKYPGNFDDLRGHAGREDFMRAEEYSGNAYEWKKETGWSQVAGTGAA